LGNYTVEPASLFLGRGDNPKRGRIKREVVPEDVIINIGKDAKVPKPPKGHKWSEVIHNQNVSWIASWKDTITGEPKYVLFAAEGQLKGKSDFMKYEKARKLNKFIKEVRELYTIDINSSDLVKRQLGTVIYLIDHFGLRAGGEKSKDETDTVGASTLRVEHVKLKPPDKLFFDFLGKDSIRYYKEMKVDKDIYRNIGDFLKGKNKGADLFNKISASDINSYLKTFDKSFTAKVFRTRLASVLMYEELKKIKLKKGESEADKKLKFDRANVAVAEVLNHQRTVSAKNKEAITKLETKLKDLKKDLKEKKAEGKSTESIQKRIDSTVRSIQSKSDTLNVAMATSRTNYIDPRIVVAWCEKNDLDISKVYTAPNQKKFKWAIDTTGPDWDYYTTPLPEGMNELNPVDTVEPSKPRPERSPRRKSIGKKPSPVSSKSPSKDKSPSEKTPLKRSHSVPKSLSLQFHEFSKTAFIVIGGSSEQQNILRNIGGAFNPNFNLKDKRVSGFIFKKGQEEEVKQAVGYISPEKIHSDPLIAFYLNQRPNHSGYMFNEIMSWSKLKLEQKHDFIQALFPLPTKSKYVPDVPVLTESALKEFQNNDIVRLNVIKAYLKMMNFFGYEVNVSNRTIKRVEELDLKIQGVKVGLMNLHNYLRITRMLTFLRIANFSILGWLFVLGLCRDLKEDEEFRIRAEGMNSITTWLTALGLTEDFVKNYNL
jgi:DNA topoisomerase I